MMQWSTSKFTNESLTRQVFIPPHPCSLSPTLRAVERGGGIFVLRYFTQWVIDFRNKKA
jgi:hypothetical protein